MDQFRLASPSACSATFTTVLVAMAAFQPDAAQSKAQNFVCSTSGGIPATIASMANGRQIPMILWKSNVFDGAGWTPERRCQEVSARFDSFNRQDRLRYITTGRINGQPVICTTPSNNGGCDGLLYTLKPGQNATKTLRDLFDVRDKARAPLYESNGRLYLNVDDLLGAPKDSGDSGRAETLPGGSSSIPNKKLF